MNWEIGIDMYTLICIKWITTKNLLYKKINKIKLKNNNTGAYACLRGASCREPGWVLTRLWEMLGAVQRKGTGENYSVLLQEKKGSMGIQLGPNKQ